MKKITKIIAGLGIVFYLIIALSTNSNTNSSSSTKEETQSTTTDETKQKSDQSATNDKTNKSTTQETKETPKNTYVELWLDQQGKEYIVPEGKYWVIQGYRSSDCNAGECFATMIVNNKEYNLLRCKEWKDVQTPWDWGNSKLHSGSTVKLGTCVLKIRVFEYTE